MNLQWHVIISCSVSTVLYNSTRRTVMSYSIVKNISSLEFLGNGFFYTDLNIRKNWKNIFSPSLGFLWLDVHRSEIKKNITGDTC